MPRPMTYGVEMSVPNQLPTSLTIGGDLTVNRLGFGAYHLTGPGCWGYPSDPDAAVRLLRHATACGVTLIDTADSYGPHVSEELIRRALHPYADGLAIATKGGLVHSAPHRWSVLGHPDYLRYSVEMSLRRLATDCIDLYFLHRIDPAYPLADQLGALKSLQEAGKIRHLGLSEVSVEQLTAAQQHIRVTSVQNLYNLANRGSDDVLTFCEQSGIAFLAWLPVAGGSLQTKVGRLQSIAEARGATRAQLALAWLLHRSPVLVPIPGTSRIEHLEENCAAAQISLSASEFHDLSATTNMTASLPDHDND